MNETNQRLINLATRARRSNSPTQAEELPVGFATRVLAQAREASSPSTEEGLALWSRLTLVSLPFAALSAVACVYWPGLEAEAGPRELASLIIESHFLP